ncbi:MAG: gliding motility-associated transport system permease protein [Verrucomicrobiota bacterium]|jgi:ABC-2 type transport system permease protein
MNNSARNIWTIAKREINGYFASPVAYVFIVIFLLLMGFFTFSKLGGFFEGGEASLAFPFFRWHPWLYLFLVPAVGMRLWSEERRLHTMELLLTMPITPWQAIVGKFIASWLFLAIALALTFPVVFTVCYLGHADIGTIFCGYLGSLMVAGGYLAVTCLTSAMTRNQVISFILSVVICLFLLLVGFELVTEWFVRWAPDWAVKTMAAFSFYPHFINFQKGTIDSRDLVYFASVIGFSLFSTGVVIRNLRAG